MVAFTNEKTFIATHFPTFWEELCDRISCDTPFRISQIRNLEFFKSFAASQHHRYARVLLNHAIAQQSNIDGSPHIIKRGQSYVLPSH